MPDEFEAIEEMPVGDARDVAVTVRLMYLSGCDEDMYGLEYALQEVRKSDTLPAFLAAGAEAALLHIIREQNAYFAQQQRLADERAARRSPDDLDSDLPF